MRKRPSCGPVRGIFQLVRFNLPPLNFITLHYGYFIFTCLLSAIIFWGASTPSKSVDFTDSLFMCVSAMTLAGLNTVNLSELNTFQQFMMFFLIMIGSAIFVSSFVVHVRRKAFERKIHKVAHDQKEKHAGRRFSASRRLSIRSLTRGRRPSGSDEKPPPMGDTEHPANPARDEKGKRSETDGEQEPSQPSKDPSEPSPHDVDGHEQDSSEGADKQALTKQPTKEDHVSFSPDVFRHPSRESRAQRSGHRILNMQGVGASSGASLQRHSSLALKTAHSQAIVDDDDETSRPAEHSEKQFPSSASVGRNSQFHHLTEAEREALGGAEYKAIKVLAVIVPLYFVLWQLLGCIALGAWVANNRPAAARQNGLNPWWVGAFNAVSAFNNSGMSLLDANMTAFQTGYYILLSMGLFILAGNTCYPIFLRLIIWTFRKLLPDNEKWSDLRYTLQFLLDHPRRCYTNLFPRQHTWWLAISVITLNAVDWVGFEILNIGNDKLNVLSASTRTVDGLFQAIAVRSGGFYVVSMTDVRISLQVLYVVMMYISVYPVVITMRNSNVYEERSLGIYGDEPGYTSVDNDDQSITGFIRRRFNFRGVGGEQTKSYFVRQQLRAQLAHDLWWLVLAVFVIMIIEGSQFERDPATFSVFNVLFETVSGYGCVGISTGTPENNYSFAGSWHKLSKLVLCAVMIRGRHRGLPVAIDKAVLLPSEREWEAEEEDAQLHMVRTISRQGMV
ncbi:uncharacterized protein K452DRAFT_231520 [Aplosporella prunicola CBS 121167]|uniref:Potassium transport protein n=1 Tax=Aplosporella prunicola CBS 121167 TaxID=1176127 RepID=A0A6A6BAD1_9PEZI|nr:uncharacterized protein K452DRAFT_231520 [Aplosporella prunicola CBS 121167]KAF2139867.1 hypothetical protein K452DRAFT_231520 [Aplosporella prunicola CBS 121167]